MKLTGKGIKRDLNLIPEKLTTNATHQLRFRQFKQFKQATNINRAEINKPNPFYRTFNLQQRQLNV